ncbi:MAG: LamG domain-containing protein, partial [archaeon]
KFTDIQLKNMLVGINRASVNPDGNYFLLLENNYDTGLKVTTISLDNSPWTFTNDLWVGKKENYIMQTNDYCAFGSKVPKRVSIVYRDLLSFLDHDLNYGVIYFDCEDYAVVTQSVGVHLPDRNLPETPQTHTPIEVTLLTPVPETISSTSTIDFSFRFIDLTPVSSCTLKIDGVDVNSITSNLVSRTVYTFTQTITTGTHLWDVNCVDEYGFDVGGDRNISYSSASTSAYAFFTSVSNTTLLTNWNKSNFVYQRASDNAWTATGELDWNGQAVLDNNSWKDANLIAYWKFNSSSGTSVPDFAGTHTATLSGGALTNAFGLWDSNALNLSGTSQYATTPNVFDLNFDANTPFTMSAWFKTGFISVADNYLPLLTKEIGASTYKGNFLGMNGNGGKISYWMINNVATNNYLRIDGTRYNYDDLWHQVVLVNSGGGNCAGIQIYVDGTLDTGTCVRDTLTGTIQTNQAFEIGARTTTTAYWRGLIDEVKIYDRALSATEVGLDYNSFLSSKFRDSNTINAGGSATLSSIKINKDLNYNFNKELTQGEKFWDTNLVGVWHFNNVTQNANIVNGKVGNALVFDGTDDYVAFANNSLFNFNKNDFTISVWVYPTSFSGYNGLFSGSSYTGTCQNGYSIYTFNTGVVKLSTNCAVSNLVTSGTETLTLGAWNHVIITRNGTGASGLNIYINAVAGSAPATGDVSINTASVGTVIGRYYANYSGHYFDGLIDNFRLWNIALTDTDINRIFLDENGGQQAPSADLNRSNLVSEWLFDENQTNNWGQITPDTSGNGNYGTQVNMAGVVVPDSTSNHLDANIFNGVYLSTGTNSGLWDTNAGNFDGSNDYASVPDSAVLKLGTVYSMSVWIKRNATGNVFSKIVTRQNATNDGFSLLIGGDWWAGTVGQRVCFGAGDSSLANEKNFCAGLIIDTNWHHIYVESTGSVLNIYLDGALWTYPIAARTAGSYPTINQTANMIIGRGNSTQWFNGKVEELAIWNRILTPLEIQDLYRKGVSRLDLNVLTCSDANCNTITGNTLLTDVNNNVDLNVGLTGQYFNYDLQ